MSKSYKTLVAVFTILNSILSQAADQPLYSYNYFNCRFEHHYEEIDSIQIAGEMVVDETSPSMLNRVFEIRQTSLMSSAHSGALQNVVANAELKDVKYNRSEAPVVCPGYGSPCFSRPQDEFQMTLEVTADRPIANDKQQKQVNTVTLVGLCTIGYPQPQEGSK